MDVVSLIGSLVEVPDKSGNRSSLLKRLEAVSIKQELKAAAALGLAYHTSCKELYWLRNQLTHLNEKKPMKVLKSKAMLVGT